MFWFLLIALVVVVAAVTLAVVGGGESAVLPESEPERVADALPAGRPVTRADVDSLRLPVTARGYRMAEVDEVLLRLGAELAERDARIAALEAALAGAQAVSTGGPDLFKRAQDPAGPTGDLPGGLRAEGSRDPLGPWDSAPGQERP
ncbi:DivIVA domain-containing protein [Streptomyces sp. NPDC097619]|uniref:DivIVA domain-containing protein n=1 Tax=Streptomyces sp. NPDC097619 TaxID=3157228 RepID=UPI0033346BF1